LRSSIETLNSFPHAAHNATAGVIPSHFETLKILLANVSLLTLIRFTLAANVLSCIQANRFSCRASSRAPLSIRGSLLTLFSRSTHGKQRLERTLYRRT
jgi:hypothetical protein